MRGEPSKQTSMLVLRSPEDLVPKEHPIRQVKAMADAVLREMTGRFDEMYAGSGRESVPPEALLKGSLLIALYSVRSERLFCEQLAYNMLFRWFLDMDMTEEPFNHSTFSKNRERLMGHDVAREFFQRVVGQARQAKLMSSEHFTVDGTLIESWASLKSLQPKEERKRERNRRKAKRRSDRDGKGGGASGGSNPTVDFRGQKRSNETHESKTDPEAKLARRGHAQPSKLYFGAHALMENRNGLLVDLRIEEAHGTAERDTALLMLAEDLPGSRRITVGADKGYDTQEFVELCRSQGVTPHVACNDTKRRSALDNRTVRHPGYLASQRVRKRVEEIFGWLKTVGGFRRTRFKGRRKTQLAAYLAAAAYNLVRMARLLPTPA
jgi:transposase